LNVRRLLRPAFLVGVVAVIVRVDPVLGVFVVLVGWAWVSWSVPSRALAGLTGRRVVPERVLFGEQVTVDLRLGASRWLPWLYVTDAIPFDLGSNTRWVTSLRGGETRHHESSFHARRRGLHRIGPTVAAAGDTFGLRRVQTTLVPASTILIYPRIVPLEVLTVAAGAPLPIIPTRTPLYEDPTRIVGVREYQAGDPMRKIHWTASAASGTMVVKKHRPGIARDVVLALDLTRDSHPMPGRRRSGEIAVTAAASIVHHLVTVRKEPVGIRIVGRDSPTGEDGVAEVAPGRDQGRMARMLEMLARAELSATVSLDALLDPARLPFGASLVLLTGRTDRRHVLDILRLKRFGITVSVIATSSDLHREGWESELQEVGVPVRWVARLADMVEL
jgi:uncharacterized protein (DUF58 family)